MGQFTLERKSDSTGIATHNAGYYLLYDGNYVMRQQRNEAWVRFETQDANFNPDYFEVLNKADQSVRAKFLKYNGEYILSSNGNPYVVPYTFNFEAFIAKYNSLAIPPSTEGYAGYTSVILANAFRPGGIDDLQRSYEGGQDRPFAISFTASASFVYGVASSIMGIDLNTCIWAGGKVNWIQSLVPGAENNTSGEQDNNPNNLPNIRQGHKFGSWLRSPNSRINKADTNDITYDLTLPDSLAATTTNSVSATRSDATLTQVNGVEENLVNPGQTVVSLPNDVYSEGSDQQETGAQTAQTVQGFADLIKRFWELAEYYYGLYLGPENRAWIVEEDDEDYCYYEQIRERAWTNAVVTAEKEMSAYLSALTFAKEPSNVEPTLSGGPLYASLASDYQMYSMGSPPASSDPLSMLRRVIFGHDNLELANNQFKKAVKDTIYKDIYPLMLTIGQIGNTAAVGAVVTPFLAPTAAAPGNFVIEVAKKKSENYDRSNYTWEIAFIEAGQEIGIDLVVGMGAGKMSKAIAEKFDLTELAQLGLEQSLDYLLKKGVDQILENN